MTAEIIAHNALLCGTVTEQVGGGIEKGEGNLNELEA